MTQVCKFVAQDKPRVIPDEHFDNCDRVACDSCWPCKDSHCASCGRNHVDPTDQACVNCLNTAREDLGTIATLCGFPLLEEVLARGVNSEAAMLLGPAADVEAWRHRAMSASMGRVDAAYLEDCRDELHPTWSLAWIENEWREAYDHPTSAPVTISAAVDYIGRMLHVVAGSLLMQDGSQAPEFDEAKRRLAACRSHLEDVLSEGLRDEKGAPCPRCGKGALVKSYGNVEAEDRWQCKNRECRQWWTEHDYRGKVAAVYEMHADALTASAIHRAYRVPEGSTRAWASGAEPTVRKRGKDEDGRQLYDVGDVLAKRDARSAAGVGGDAA